MIIGVPHSGNRSLRTHLKNLGEKDLELRHFGIHDVENVTEAHIPLRNPVELALSWDARYPYDDGHAPENMHDAIRKMIEWSEKRNVTWWRTEDLPVHEGKGPERHNAVENRRVRAFLDWYHSEPMVMVFYTEHGYGG